MTFIDPDSPADRLLWLRADRGVLCRTAAHWDGVTHTQLRGPSGGGLQTGDVDFGFACWVRINALPATANLARGETHLAGKWVPQNHLGREWLLCLNSPTGADQFRIVARGQTGSAVVHGPHSTIPGGIEPGRWYFVVAWSDTASRTLNLSVDGVSMAPVPYAGAPSANQQLAFTLGALSGASGRPAISMARAMFFKETPGGIGGRIEEIIATLYGGAELVDLRPGQAEQWGVVAYWPLDERGGVRRNQMNGLRSLDLQDPSGVGWDVGPLDGPAKHDRLMSGWVDQVGGRRFSGSGPLWRGDSTRVVAAGRGERLEHGGPILSGRPRWTATVVGSLNMDLGAGLYGEATSEGEEEALEIRIGHGGVPELAIRSAGGPEVVARASDTLAGRRAATAVSAVAVTTTSDSIPRVRCRVHVGAGHPFAGADLLWVKGLGPPFDGLQAITHATVDEIWYVVDHPGTPPATAGARRFPGAFSAGTRDVMGVARHSLDRRFAAPWSGSSWTVAGWVRRTADGPDAPWGGGVFVAKDCGDPRGPGSCPQILHGGSGGPGTYRLALPGGPEADFGPAPRDAWVHLAAVRSGDVIALYYDGQPAGQLDVSSAPSLGSTFAGLGFGVDATAGSGLPCLVDNWGVWLGRSLSAAEVAALHGGGAGPAFAALPAALRSGLTAWYDFDEVSGDALDASGNGRHLVERGLVPAAEGVGGGIPFASAASGGVVVGSGRVVVAVGIRPEAGSGVDYRRFVLTVRRDGGQVSFFRGGEPIGAATIDPAALGPSSASASARVLGVAGRLRAPHGSVEHVHLVGDALADAEAIGLAARFSIRVDRTRGVGPLSVFFDATQMAGVDRMAAQDYHYLWTFTRSGEGRLHDEWRSARSGQAYARSTGFFVSQVFEREGSYDAHLAVVSSRFDRSGRPQPRSCLFAGKVATITVDPWPDSTVTYYVSSTHPARDDAGPGTSPDAPLATVREAVRRFGRPFTRALFRRGDEFPTTSRIALEELEGPLLIGAYGDPEADRPTWIAATRAQHNVGDTVRVTGTHDLRVSGVAIRDTGDMNESSPTYVKVAYFSGGRNRLLLLHDVAVHETNRLMYIDTSDRGIVVDRSYLASLGDYTIYAQAAYDFSMTRCALEGWPKHHYVRYQHSHRTQVAHCDRRTAPYPFGLGMSWVTIRHQTRYFVVTDCFGDVLGTTCDPAFLDWLGPRWGIFERNVLRYVDVIGHQVTLRNTALSITGGGRRINWTDARPNLRGGLSEDGLVYETQRLPDVGLQHVGAAGFLVNEENRILGATGALEAPPIALAEAVGGAAILAASGGGVGGPEPWRFRWMRRPAGGDGPFEPLMGQASSAIYDIPPGPGAYEYRLDLITDSGIEALGASAATVVIAADGDGPGYLLGAPEPAEGPAGVPSGPFGVSILGEPPALPVTITPAADGPGHFDPPQVVLSAEGPSASFRFIPGPPSEGVGPRQIATTNDAGLIDPPPVTFLVTMPVGDPPPDDPPPGDPPPRLADLSELLHEVVPPGGVGRTVLSGPSVRVDPGRETGPSGADPVRPLSAPARTEEPGRRDRDRPDRGPGSLAPRPRRR